MRQPSQTALLESAGWLPKTQLLHTELPTLQSVYCVVVRCWGWCRYGLGLIRAHSAVPGIRRISHLDQLSPPHQQMICHSPYLRSSLLSPSLSWNFYLTKSEAISLSLPFSISWSLLISKPHISRFSIDMLTLHSSNLQFICKCPMRRGPLMSSTKKTK